MKSINRMQRASFPLPLPPSPLQRRGTSADALDLSAFPCTQLRTGALISFQQLRWAHAPRQKGRLRANGPRDPHPPTPQQALHEARRGSRNNNSCNACKATTRSCLMGEREPRTVDRNKRRSGRPILNRHQPCAKLPLSCTQHPVPCWMSKAGRDVVDMLRSRLLGLSENLSAQGKKLSLRETRGGGRGEKGVPASRGARPGKGGHGNGAASHRDEGWG